MGGHSKTTTLLHTVMLPVDALRPFVSQSTHIPFLSTHLPHWAIAPPLLSEIERCFSQPGHGGPLHQRRGILVYFVSFLCFCLIHNLFAGFHILLAGLFLTCFCKFIVSNSCFQVIRSRALTLFAEGLTAISFCSLLSSLSSFLSVFLLWILT